MSDELNQAKGSQVAAHDAEDDHPEIQAADFGASDDGRDPFEWDSRYPNDALRIIRAEALALVFALFLALIGLLVTWLGAWEAILAPRFDKEFGVLNWFAYVCFSGLAAGSIFSMKWLYHAVGKGYWHIDRQLWRFMSPLISLSVAFFVSILIHANLIDGPGAVASPSTAIAIGFLAGYFSDNAIAKMLEVANVLFGSSVQSRHPR